MSDITTQFCEKYNTNLDENFEPTGIVLSNGTKYGRCKLCMKPAYLVAEESPQYPKAHKMWRHGDTGHTQCGTMKENGDGTMRFVEFVR